MTTVPQLARLLQTLLTETANHCGRETGFIQRQGKVTGALFIQTLLCGWLSAADATLELLANTGHSCGLDISPQGVDARFTERAATFLKAVLDAAMTTSVSTVGVTVGLIGRFAGVYLVDSTQIALPDSLVAVWRGTGSTTGRRAALKTQVQLDLATGALTAELMAGRCHDRTAAAQHAALPKGALRVADLGYYSLAVLAAFSSAGVYWVSRISSQTCLVVDGPPIHLHTFLAAQHPPEVDVSVRVGAKERVTCRVVAQRVPLAIAEQRRRRQNRDAKRRGQAVSTDQRALADWTLYATNTPPELLTLPDIHALYRARWQIELLFKLWKSESQLDQSRSAKPWRILCEVYAKLFAVFVQHWLLVVTCWQFTDRSLTKAAQVVHSFGRTFALAFGAHLPLDTVLWALWAALQRGCRINTRADGTHTFQLLADNS